MSERFDSSVSAPRKAALATLLLCGASLLPLLAGCGQKGPLTLPPPAEVAPAAPSPTASAPR